MSIFVYASKALYRALSKANNAHCKRNGFGNMTIVNDVQLGIIPLNKKGLLALLFMLYFYKFLYFVEKYTGAIHFGNTLYKQITTDLRQ